MTMVKSAGPQTADVSSTEEGNQRPLLFLDIDDVICTNSPYGGYDLFAPDPPRDLWACLFHPPAVATLRVIVEELDPQVVITSSWLRFMQLDAFERLFARCGMVFVSERLHAAGETLQMLQMTRLQAIEGWLETHHRGEPFVVLDDDLSGTGLRGSWIQAQGRLVLCQVGEGLRSEDVPQVRGALLKRGRT